MSFDLVMRTLGVITCLYTVAYFITSMSVAALNAATFGSGPMCGADGCVTVAHEQRLLPGDALVAGSEPLWMAVLSLD